MSSKKTDCMIELVINAHTFNCDFKLKVALVLIQFISLKLRIMVEDMQGS